jgi:hypothetical protein
MNFDLRFPIGIMFSLFGTILTVFGLVSDPAIYKTRLWGTNINALWGGVLLAFGVVMLLLALRARKKAPR